MFTCRKEGKWAKPLLNFFFCFSAVSTLLLAPRTFAGPGDELFRWGRHHAPPGHQLQILYSAWVVHRAKQDRATLLSTASRQPAHRPVTQDAGAAPHDDKRPTRFVSRGLEYSLFLASEATVSGLGGGVGRAPVVTKLRFSCTGALRDAAAPLQSASAIDWQRGVRLPKAPNLNLNLN